MKYLKTQRFFFVLATSLEIISYGFNLFDHIGMSPIN